MTDKSLASETVPPDFHLLRMSWVYCQAPKAPLLKRMPTGPMYFCTYGALEFQLVPGFHYKKGLVPNSVLMGRRTNTHIRFRNSRGMRDICVSLWSSAAPFPALTDLQTSSGIATPTADQFLHADTSRQVTVSTPEADQSRTAI